ncbi:hypothetical protein HBN50_05990 [Halobacteriovorax sp. GB3]|uniref:hypothetical protein n=1 Tax=Halobacteriovorax sp. GB3 TaxID=2719615 RepID=UPI002360A923|nr:hypothetical protein [Halobacteriovorax sp. GB3]MDD0852637.1 hypothetical protein [Halobacteriovorax sp. GB3]
MLKRFRNSIFALCTFSLSFHSYANQSHKSLFSFKNKESYVLKSYDKIHKKFSRTVCAPGVEEKFWQLDKNFRGDGHFIPTLDDETLDKEAIKKNLSVLKDKHRFLQNELVNLRKKKLFKKSINEVRILKKKISKLLHYKKESYGPSAGELKLRAKSDYESFKSETMAFLNSITFLHTYPFPTDFANLRMNFDLVKDSEEISDIKKKNEIYLYRKIVEDGAQNKKHERPDRYLRANISTVYLRLQNTDEYLSEDLRYDLESIFDGIERQLRYSKRKKIERMQEWTERSKRALDFYEMLLQDKVVLDGKSLLATDLLGQKAKARYVLKDFVLEKEKETYKFWIKQNPLYRSLFALETILYNEVGRIDSKGAPERRSVAQVVINRRFNDKYNSMGDETDLYTILERERVKTKNYPWLNVMFKKGEFSFTYFFISANLRIYCPDQTKIGRKLRKENLKLVLSLLKKPNFSFGALRYFSRASMLGRIDMAPLWSDYHSLPEEPGVRIYKDKRLKALYKKGGYQFLYRFKDAKGAWFRVLRIGRRNYVLSEKSQRFYTYRNPHYFRYFEQIKNS